MNARSMFRFLNETNDKHLDICPLSFGHGKKRHPTKKIIFIFSQLINLAANISHIHIYMITPFLEI